MNVSNLDTALTARSGEHLSGREVREMIRGGALKMPTAGLAHGFLQANIVILPAVAAEDFRDYCDRNPKPCPLLGMSEPGDPALPGLGDIDIRTDIARYRVHRNGVHSETADNLSDLWRDDFVAFALGCSFSFEAALMREGIAVRHVDAGRNVPMYATTIATTQAGPFRGPMVVTMRAFPPADLARAAKLSQGFPLAHGAPVHTGDPAAIGIRDIHRPDFGDPPVIVPGDVFGFWACGVTPQLAIKEAKPELAITHEPGYMLVTDLPADLQRAG